MKPNDVIALIIGLHILLLGLLSYGLVRLFRVWPPLSSTTYSSSYLNSESGSADDRHSPPPPPRPGPPFFPGPIPGGWVGLRSPQLGLGRTNRSPRPDIVGGFNVNDPGHVAGGRINADDQQPAVGGRINADDQAPGAGGRVNIDDPEPGPGGRVNVSPSRRGTANIDGHN